MVANNASKKTLINPKANLPAVYIPNWLVQVSTLEISFGAKILYGRLTQWCNEKGHVFRPASKLSKEIGCSESQTKRYIRELKTLGLIGTYQSKSGGCNNFEFYDHPWMHAPLDQNLCYKSDISDISSSCKDESPPGSHKPPPSVISEPTPRSDVSYYINKKEIKRISKEYIGDSVEPPLSSKKEMTVNDLLQDNPYQIEKEVIEDWVLTRKKKRAAITKTAWRMINENLRKCLEMGIQASEAFATMVASGWLSLKAEWFIKKQEEHKPKPYTLDEVLAGGYL